MLGNLIHLKKYFARYKKNLIWGFIFIILSNIGQVYVPILLKDSIDALQKNLREEILIKYALSIVGVTILSGFFRYMIRQTIIVMSRHIEYDLRHDFWEHIQKLPLRFFQNNSTGNIMSHATNDISAVRMAVGPSVMYSLDNGTKFLMILPLMIILSPILTFYSLLPLPVFSFLVYLVMKKVHVKYTRIQEKFSELTTKAQENFAGIRVIKSYVREDYEIKEFTRHSSEYLMRHMDLVRLQAFFQPIFFSIAGLSSIIVLLVGGDMVIKGSLSLGVISAFFAYLGMLIWPMISFGWVANMIQQADASMKRLLKIFREPSEIYDKNNEKNSNINIKGEIEFRNVEFRYSDVLPPVLQNISFKIKQGQTVAFIGHTGVGKTTLINLIPRLYDPTKGEVLIDGVNVKEIPLDVLRTNIGLVSQETFLFSDTLANNIAYGLNNKVDGIVERTANIAQLSKDVSDFPKGFDTIVGERGITLSGGQKQRTTLARALAIDPKILILDDSFSAVDTNTEESILRELKMFMKDRTSIIISHRISTVKDSDKIFVLDKGSIVEEGTHEELVAKGGIYADLYFKQLLEEELKEIN
ncbi:ABC transporter ATP-binding protein [Melioribacteraceae bacterium 4301-Me]|uniref:ABC transporter ATP-binding protein n=1 Tax=Pyranulibacter aquaticus TaxID=3163344 RepID=UPI00359BDE9C